MRETLPLAAVYRVPVCTRGQSGAILTTRRGGPVPILQMREKEIPEIRNTFVVTWLTGRARTGTQISQMHSVCTLLATVTYLSPWWCKFLHTVKDVQASVSHCNGVKHTAERRGFQPRFFYYLWSRVSHAASLGPGRLPPQECKTVGQMTTERRPSATRHIKTLASQNQSWNHICLALTQTPLYSCSALSPKVKVSQRLQAFWEERKEWQRP